MITEVEQEKAVVKMEDVALTPDELSEQLYGVNNNEEEITMTAHVETDEEIEGETVVLPGFTSTGPTLPGFTSTGPTKVVERNEAGEPLTSVTFGIMEYGEKVAEEELPLPLSHIPDGMAMKEEQQEFNWEIAGEQKEEPVVDLDQEEDDDWDQLEAAGVITKSGSDFDIDKVQSEEESVFELPKAPGLHEEMREMDQAIQDDSDNIPQLNASNRGDEVEIERVAEKPGTIQEAFDIPEMPAPDTATEDEDTSDDLVVEEQSTGGAVEDLSSEEFFISEMDLGMSPEPGETVTIGDDYYYVDRRTELDGVPGYTLMGVTEEEEEEEVTQLSQEEIVQQIAEDEAAVAEVCDKPSEEPDPVEDSEPEEEFEIADAPGQRSINVLGNNLPNGTVTDVEEEEEVVDASEQFNKLIENREQEEKNSRIKEAISKQITELYGVPQEFSFIEGAGQYNVTLETGESFVIDAGVVNSAISNLNV
jgi:hypothetical protein